MARPSSQQVGIEVHGLAELNRDWPIWERRTVHELGPALERVAVLTRDVLRVKVPVKTGRFRASSRTQRIEGPNPTVALLEGEGVVYARWLEYGKRRGGRAPKSGRYLVPTARRQKRLVKKSVVESTKQSIARYPWPKWK